MHLDEIIQYCSSLKGVTDHFPFDERTLVLKVQGKMFALIDVENPEAMNLKCDPEKAIELRERFDGIRPGYHMNKKHWNSVYLDGSVNDPLIRELIVHSYDLVVKSLPKKLQHELEIG